MRDLRLLLTNLNLLKVDPLKIVLTLFYKSEFLRFVLFYFLQNISVGRTKTTEEPQAGRGFFLIKVNKQSNIYERKSQNLLTDYHLISGTTEWIAIGTKLAP